VLSDLKNSLWSLAITNREKDKVCLSMLGEILGYSRQDEVKICKAITSAMRWGERCMCRISTDLKWRIANNQVKRLSLHWPKDLSRLNYLAE
jgi:hypothetical protein